MSMELGVQVCMHANVSHWVCPFPCTSIITYIHRVSYNIYYQTLLNVCSVFINICHTHFLSCFSECFSEVLFPLHYASVQDLVEGQTV